MALRVTSVSPVPTPETGRPDPSLSGLVAAAESRGLLLLVRLDRYILTRPRARVPLAEPPSLAAVRDVLSRLDAPSARLSGAL